MSEITATKEQQNKYETLKEYLRSLGSVAVDHFATRAIWWSCLLLAVAFVLMFVKEEIEENPAIEKDLSAIRQEADEIDALLKEDLHEEHESWKDTLEHKN